ncbi:transcriptional regulator [Streptomyces sp. NPDC088794]|uniref:winged helix-turn-helix domain-containing protein n=1 Tax=Streptomyces sp. NPDC088794 TaxID=3365902 RepID=UPI003805303A
MSGAVFHFGLYELYTDRRRLSRDGRQVVLEPRALALLCHLVEHRDRVVPIKELLGAIGCEPTTGEAALADWVRAALHAVGGDDT